MDCEQVGGALQQEHCEGNEMQSDKGFGQALIVTSGRVAAHHPGERAFHDLAARQQHDTAWPQAA